jgi:hypothetical protein
MMTIRWVPPGGESAPHPEVAWGARRVFPAEGTKVWERIDILWITRRLEDAAWPDRWGAASAAAGAG